MLATETIMRIPVHIAEVPWETRYDNTDREPFLYFMIGERIEGAEVTSRLVHEHAPVGAHL